ncbi:MAG TPA: hypothetical protein VFP80_09695, partial [Thermoanaerobaculia bacterium]|nr:hypothetical protein [Thermoanaerobaculia bacterium]
RPPFERHTLIVTEAVPPFRLLPDVASVHGGETIRIVSKGGSCYPAAELLIGGAPVAVTQSAYCEYVFTAPPHAAGAVDATITRPGLTTKVTSAAALRYVDPSAPPDESAFERVLVPVLYNGPGAYGSQWVSEGRISVQEGPPLRWMHDVLNAECTSGACSSGRSVDFASFGNHPAGLLLFVPRGIGEIDASLLVRDTSREGSSWGAQVPVVREKDFKSAGNLQFPGVPFDPPYRGLLRIYGIDGATAGVAVGAGDSWRSPSLAGACADSVKPCNTARPAFAAVDLQQTFPELVGRGRFDVTVAPIWRVRPFRYWGFVTVTNNETQHVTVMTP